MAANDFFNGTSPHGNYTEVQAWPVKSGPTGWAKGVPIIVASGFIDIAATNPSAASLIGISTSQSADAEARQFGTSGYSGQKILPVAIKSIEDEWICHNWSTSGGGQLNTPTVAAVVGVQAGIYYHATNILTSSTDIRGSGAAVLAAFAVDTNLTAHFEGVRVLDKLFQDITVSGATGEYVVVRWLNAIGG